MKENITPINDQQNRTAFFIEVFFCTRNSLNFLKSVVHLVYCILFITFFGLKSISKKKKNSDKPNKKNTHGFVFLICLNFFVV